MTLTISTAGPETANRDRLALPKNLRRMDWRFLLPAPPRGGFDHVVVLGGSPSLSDTVVELGLAHRVSREVPSTDSADALVILEDASTQVEKAVRCLSPGGALYWEVPRQWSNLLRTSPGAIRRRLVSGGMSPVALYWPRPSFRCPAAYLPIGMAGVLPWYVRTRLDPRSPWRRAAKWILRALARRGGAWAFGLMPRYAATAIAGPAAERVFAVAEANAIANEDSGTLVPLMLLRGSGSSRRIVQLPFSRGGGDPKRVVKFWRLPDRNANTEAEQETLRKIRSQLDSSVAGSLPEPLGTVRWGEVVAALESYAPGPPLSQSLGAWGRPIRRKIMDVGPVFEWIREFQRQAQVVRKPWDREDVRQWIEEPLSSYRSAVSCGPEEDRLFAAVRLRARALIGQPLPIVWAHPDLTAANIHCQGDRVSVIDWSGAAPRLPLFDLLYFAMLWAAAMEGSGNLEARLARLRRIVFAQPVPDPITSTIREAIVRYFRDLEIATGFFPLLVTMAWTVRSIECFERARAVERGDPGANPHPEESYVEYLQALGKETEALFCERTDHWWSTSIAAERVAAP